MLADARRREAFSVRFDMPDRHGACTDRHVILTQFNVCSMLQDPTP